MNATTLPVKQRIQSIDILRGVIMLIMALDHVRDYFQLGALTSDPTNMETTTPVLFFSRWITHFCAPTFVFLSGVSAFVAGSRRSKKDFSLFLIKRGAWLIVVEIVVITLALSLNPLYNVVILQVIWVIGLSMILLGLLIWLPVNVVGILGCIIFFGHNLLDLIKLPETGAASTWLKVLFTARGAVLPLGTGRFIFVLYALLPWTGVMLFGYAFGFIYKPTFKPSTRKAVLIFTSILFFLIFMALRLGNLYGDPAPWSVQLSSTYTFLSFLNVSKYPPSLLYLTMTLSVSLMVLAFTENVTGKLAGFFKVYGNVPFFYYILHFYLIRVLTIIVFFLQGFKPSQIVTPNNPFLFTPPGFGFSLGWVYLLWLAIILALYYPCRWYSRYKQTHHQWWLSYL